MEIHDRRSNANAPQVQTTSLPANPNPGAPPPWAQHGGVPQSVPPQPRPQLQATQQPQLQQQLPTPATSFSQPTPTGSANPLTGSQIQYDAETLGKMILATLGEGATMPTANAPIAVQVAWALRTHSEDQLRAAGWWSPESLAAAFELIGAVRAEYEANERARQQGQTQSALHPTTRSVLEHAIRSGATDQQILDAYPQVGLTLEQLRDLRYAIAVPTATVPLPPALGGPQNAPPTQQQAQPQPAPTDDGEGEGAEQDGKRSQRWSKARKDRAAVLLREGRTVEAVAAEVSMSVEKVEEYRIELLTAGAIPQASAPAPQPQQASAPAAVAGAAAVVAAAMSTPELGALTLEETKGLQRLLGRALHDTPWAYDAEEQAIEAELEQQFAELEAADPVLPMHEKLARRTAIHVERRKRLDALRSLPRLMARAVDEVRAELAAWEKLSQILPRD